MERPGNTKTKYNNVCNKCITKLKLNRLFIIKFIYYKVYKNCTPTGSLCLFLPQIHFRFSFLQICLCIPFQIYSVEMLFFWKCAFANVYNKYLLITDIFVLYFNSFSSFIFIFIKSFDSNTLNFTTIDLLNLNVECFLIE